MASRLALLLPGLPPPIEWDGTRGWAHARCLDFAGCREWNGGVGDKQAAARSRGRGRSLCRDFSRPLIAVGVVRRGRGVPAASWSLFPGEREKQLPRKAVQVAERVRDVDCPHASQVVRPGAGPGACPARLRKASDGAGRRPSERSFCEETGRFDSEKRKSRIERD